jgi:hypothetical protein
MGERQETSAVSFYVLAGAATVISGSTDQILNRRSVDQSGIVRNVDLAAGIFNLGIRDPTV